MKPDKTLVIEAIKQLFVETLGMTNMVVEHNSAYKTECYSLNGEFYRIDSFVDPSDSNSRLFCIEWAENEQEALYNHFEDAWLYPDTMELQEMLATIKSDILNE